MKNIKRRPEIFSFYDRTGIAAHLEDMAARGWLLEKAGAFLWRYRRTEPQKLRYDLVYQPGMSEFDATPPEEVRRFEDLCAEAGWELAASRAQMQIYRCADPNAVPIETDPQLQLDTIHRAMKKNYIPSQIIMIVLALFQFLLGWWQYDLNPLGFLSDSSWVGLSCYVLILVMSLAELAGYFRWRKKSLEAGELCPTRGTRGLQLFSLAAVLLIAVWWLLTMTSGSMRFVCLCMLAMCLLMLAAAFGVKALLQRVGASRSVTRIAYFATAFLSAAVMLSVTLYLGGMAYNGHWFEPEVETYEWHDWTWEAYHDELPLYVQDLTATDYAEYSTKLDTQRSPILSVTTADQQERVGHSGAPNLRYEIYETLFPSWVEKLVLEEYTVREYWPPRMFLETGPELPGVQVSRLWEEQTPLNTWLIRKGNRLLILSPDWELTGEQLAAAVEKLLP